MSLPLELKDQLVDRGKSSLYLYYLARATHRVMQREIARKKVELSLKQLKKLSTKELHKHLDALELHIKETVQKEKEVQGHQAQEEETHKNLTAKITSLEKKLSLYLTTQESRKKRLEELETKVKQKFLTRKEKINALKSDYKQLHKLYNEAKKAKAKKQLLLRMAKRMDELKARIAILK